VAYTVPKLKDFSPAALDNAARELLSALEREAAKRVRQTSARAFATIGLDARTESWLK